jgi:hypothetical protein
MDTMRRECWVNRSIPKDPDELAIYLGKNADEIKVNLSIRVLSFFKEHHDQLVCPELDVYRASLEDRSKRMSEGGQKGGRVTQSKNKVAKVTLEASLKPLSGDELNRGEVSRVEKQSLGEGISSKEMADFIADYEATPDVSNKYYSASKGGY